MRLRTLGVRRWRRRLPAPIFALAAALLLLVACNSGVDTGDQTPQNSPDEVVERLLSSVIDEDWGRLYDLFSRESQQPCSRADYVKGSEVLVETAKELSPTTYPLYIETLTRAEPAFEEVADDELSLTLLVDGSPDLLLIGVPNQLLLEDGRWRVHATANAEMACEAAALVGSAGG